MTERKPADVSFESWVESQIRAAAERGDFDDLPGAGKPLPGAGQATEDQWWLKEFVRREQLPTEAMLPTPLKLRKEVDRLPGLVRGFAHEHLVRAAVADLNDRIEDWMRTGTGPVRVRFVDAEEVVDRWRADRAALAERAAAEESVPAEHLARRRWWRRR